MSSLDCAAFSVYIMIEPLRNFNCFVDLGKAQRIRRFNLILSMEYLRNWYVTIGRVWKWSMFFLTVAHITQSWKRYSNQMSSTSCNPYKLITAHSCIGDEHKRNKIKIPIFLLFFHSLSLSFLWIFYSGLLFPNEKVTKNRQNFWLV